MVSGRYVGATWTSGQTPASLHTEQLAFITFSYWGSMEETIPIGAMVYRIPSLLRAQFQAATVPNPVNNTDLGCKSRSQASGSFLSTC